MNASIQTFYFITVIIRRPTTLAHVYSRSFACVCCIHWRSTHGGLALRSRASSRYTGWQAFVYLRSLTLVRSAAAWLFVAPRQCVAGGNAFVRSRAYTAGCLFVALSAGIDHDSATHTWTVNTASKGRIHFVTVSLSLAIHLPWPLGLSSPQPRLRARRFNFSVSVVTIRCAQHLYRPHWPGKRHPQ